MELFFLFSFFNVNETFSAEKMDINPSLLSFRFLQEVHTHTAALAVSLLRPNGLNDLDVYLPTLDYLLALHPDRLEGFNVDAIDPLPPDATAVDRYNHTSESADSSNTENICFINS